MKVYKEEQRFTQTWLKIILAISVVAPIIVVTKEYLEENSKVTTKEYILTLIGITVSVAFIFLFKLKTRIDDKGIHYQFAPFHFKLKVVAWNAIEKATVRTYDSIREYGGWGLKGGFLWSKEKGKCVNISGNIGLQLIFKNGEKLLIGTQQKDAVESVLKRYKHKIQ
jgi:hypothetical protein